MGLGALLARAQTNVTVTTSNEAGAILGSDSFAIIDGLMPTWSAAPYRGAMNLPGAWRAAIIAADLLGSLPWEAYEQDPSGVPVLAPDQPPVLRKPAPPDAGITTVSSFGLDYIWHGNAVALLGPLTPAGDVSAMAPVPISNVAIGRSNGRDVPGFYRGQTMYLINGRHYRPDQVLHLKGPCEPGALRGLGALEVHLSGGLRTALELQRQAGDLDVSGVPTGTLKVTAPDLTPIEAATLKASWVASQRARTVAVLNDVTEFTPLAWNPTDMQLLEARKFSLHEIALIVGVPLYFLGVDTSSKTYANVEQEGIVLTRFHLGGAIRRMEAAFTECMRPGRTVLADLSDALRADTKTRYEAWQIGLTSGFLTVNEVRNREHLPPIAGGDVVAAPAAEPQTARQPDSGPPEMAENSQQQGRALVGALLAELRAGIDQPRHPQGTSEGGQWLGDSGPPRAADTGGTVAGAPELAAPRKGQGGGRGTGLAPYRLSKRKFCPTCGGKAQDPQMSEPLVTDGPDGEFTDPDIGSESCDEPYHDKSDADYEDD